MAYIHGERHQAHLFPASIEDYISLDDPVRAYDAFVDQLNFDDLGIVYDDGQVGPPEYDPKAMVKLLVYGYSYGERSSRKLERAAHHNVSFIWLTGGLKPDHKTIAQFRRGNKAGLKNILKQCARLCLKLGLIEGNTLFVDGTKIRANASTKHIWTKQRCDDVLAKIDCQIEALLAECDATDDAEEEHDSLVQMQEELKNKETLKAKVQQILKELKQTQQTSINATDPDSRRMKGRQGSHASYNMQNTVDDKEGLIVSSDVVTDENDRNQFSNQINQANDTLDKKCETACGDAGYSNTNNLKIVDDQQIRVIVPSQKQASSVPPEPFDKENFTYDTPNDCYICPEGHALSYRSTDAENKKHHYRMSRPALCRACPHFGTCTKSSQGRSIIRLVNEQLKEKLEKQYLQPESQAIYRRRKEKAELPFGHFKRNLKVTAFLLRGLAGVRAEASLLSTSFNMARMITILGVSGLIEKIKKDQKQSQVSFSMA
ncbi:MAG: IS1182 family transposase [Planctomycetes bacterium]|nr:IS1182 family transposase [Planctomycetota bacterium]